MANWYLELSHLECLTVANWYLELSHLACLTVANWNLELSHLACLIVANWYLELSLIGTFEMVLIGYIELSLFITVGGLSLLPIAVLIVTLSCLYLDTLSSL